MRLVRTSPISTNADADVTELSNLALADLKRLPGHFTARNAQVRCFQPARLPGYLERRASERNPAPRYRTIHHPQPGSTYTITWRYLPPKGGGISAPFTTANTVELRLGLGVGSLKNHSFQKPLRQHRILPLICCHQMLPSVRGIMRSGGSDEELSLAAAGADVHGS